MVPLPDGSWRVAGVASTSFVEYVTPWHHVEWMLDDPNIDAEDIIPCHTAAGDWAPTESCGEFPLSPDQASGSWARGPMACFTSDIGGPSATCGPPFGSGSGSGGGTGGIATDSAGFAPDPEPEPADERGGCNGCTTAPSPVRWSGLGLAGLLLAGRRRRWPRIRGGALMAIVGVLLGGCPDPGGGGGSGTETDATTGAPADPIDFGNSDFKHIVSGVSFDDDKEYTQLAVGPVSRALGDASCCQDYVIGGDSPTVRVVFSDDLPGLSFLEDAPDELVNVGGTQIEDLHLADLNGDGRNDLLALRSDSMLAIRLGLDTLVPPFFDPDTLILVDATLSDVVGRGSVVTADVDCDDQLDAVVTAPDANSIIILKGGGDGTFAVDSAPGAGVAPQNLEVADLEPDGDTDIVVANRNGRFSVLLSTCSGFEDLASYSVIEGIETPGMPLAVGNVCPGHPDVPSVAVGVYDRVFLTCGDGSGQFEDIEEPHGETLPNSPVDYRWDPSEGSPSAHRVDDLMVWPESRVLFVLWRPGGSSHIDVLKPSNDEIDSPRSGPTVRLGGVTGTGWTEAHIHNVLAGAPDWTRIAFVGVDGLGVTR